MAPRVARGWAHDRLARDVLHQLADRRRAQVDRAQQLRSDVRQRRIDRHLAGEHRLLHFHLDTPPRWVGSGPGPDYGARDQGRQVLPDDLLPAVDHPGGRDNTSLDAHLSG